MAWSSIGIDNSTWTWASSLRWVAAEHGDARSELGTSKGDHVLADVVGNLLTLMVMRVHENPLNEVVAVLVARNVD